MKGVLIFYVNVNPEYETELVSSTRFIDFIMETNKSVIERVKGAGYDVMLVPCVGEASRTEKITFEV